MVDMDGNGGLGDVVTCRKDIVYDTLGGYLTGVKHANGRDWWIVCNESFTNKYYKILVTPDTMMVSEQQIGPVFDTTSWSGQSNFSNDGNWYARADATTGVVVMQFDRCTGMFSNPIHDTMLTMQFGGVGFSSNNKFMYVFTWLDLYQ
ncbi:MAG: hypothetical protein IPO27_02325 [Bacteroidetes bacterium]|nr:hypothetical protein [Bacteroidota bacterium]